MQFSVSILLAEYRFKQSQNRKWCSFTKFVLYMFPLDSHCYSTRWYISQITGLITYAHFLNGKCTIWNICLKSETLCSLRQSNWHFFLIRYFHAWQLFSRRARSLPPLSTIFKWYMVIWGAEIDFLFQYGHMGSFDIRPFFWFPEIP